MISQQDYLEDHPWDAPYTILVKRVEPAAMMSLDQMNPGQKW